jgi:hypothetical protein
MKKNRHIIVFIGFLMLISINIISNIIGEKYPKYERGYLALLLTFLFYGVLLYSVYLTIAELTSYFVNKSSFKKGKFIFIFPFILYLLYLCYLILMVLW